METAKLESIVTPILETRELFLVELKISRDNVIEIVIDGLKGVNIQTCIEISREIETHLNRDEEDFELTVSSAGISYPFLVEGQFKKNMGNEIEVKLNDGQKCSGILKAYDAQSVSIEYQKKETVEGSKKKQMVTHTDTLQRENIREICNVIKF